MNPTILAMRRPVTTLMLVVALVSGGVLAYSRMRVDIFPSLNTPKIYVFLDYVGMSPEQVEGFIVNELELYFQYVDGDLRHQDAQHPASCPLRAFFLPGHGDGAGDGPGRGDVRPGDVVDAQGDLAADDHADGRRQRPGRLPRLREREDLARGDGRPGPERDPAAGAEERPGTVAISPFGPNMRSIVISVDPQKLLSYNLDPQKVVECAGQGEHDHPGGEYLRERLDADGRQQRDRRRHPEAGLDPAQAGDERLPPRRGHHQGRHRHHVWLRPGQRQEIGLSADHQEGHRLDADRRGRHPQVDATVQGQRPLRTSRSASSSTSRPRCWRRSRALRPRG